MDPVSLETMEKTSLGSADVFPPPQTCRYKIGLGLHINPRYADKISTWRFLHFCGKKKKIGVVLLLIMIILCFGIN